MDTLTLHQHATARLHGGIRKLQHALLPLLAMVLAGVCVTGVEAQVVVRGIWYMNPLNSTNLPKCTTAATQATDVNGTSSLTFKPTQWAGGNMFITNNSGCMQNPLGEINGYAAIQFDYQGTEAACDAVFKFSRYRLCGSTGSSYESARILIRDYIERGVISSTEWRRVVIPVADLLKSAAFNCDLKDWDLTRFHYQLTATVCNSCAPGPQNTCSLRNVVLLGSVPPPMNKAPRISIANATLPVPFGAVIQIPSNITDDGLPSGSTLTILWTLVAGPVGWNASAGLVIFSNASAVAPLVGFSTAAPLGNYTLAVTATDGAYTTTAQMLLTHVSSPPFVAITAPRPPTLTMPLIVTVRTICLMATLQSGLLPPGSVSVTWSSAPAVAFRVIPSDSSGLTVNATFPSMVNVTDYLITLTVRVNATQFVRTTTLAIKQATGIKALRLTPPWKAGTRIPFFMEEDLEGVSNRYPTLLQETANIHITASGTWSSILPSTFLTAGDCVLIAAGFSVTYDVCTTTRLRCVVVLGTLTFSPTASTCLNVGTLQLHYGGVLNITHTASTAKTNVTFMGSLDTREDPAQETVGLVSYHSTVALSGRTRCGHRLLASGMNNGSTSITVPGASACWLAGEEIVLADTQEGTNIDYWTYVWDPTKGQTETATIASITGDKVTLRQPLKFNHRATYVGHMTRSLVFQGAPNFTRPTVFLIGRSRVQIKYTQFLDLGRTTTDVVNNTVFASSGATVVSVGTNQLGRYAVHMHRIREKAVELTGNTVWGKASLLPRHGFVLHDSRGFFTDCVAVGARGAGFFAEDGTETGTILRGLSIGLGGGSGADDDVRFETVSKGTDMGHGGFGFWSRNALVRMEDNAAVGLFLEAAFGFYVHNNHLAGRTVPDIPGTPDAIRGKSLPTFASIPFQLYGGFLNNVALGTYRQALALMYSVAQPYQLVQNFTSTALALSGRGLHIIHGGPFLLLNCSFVATVPLNTITGVFKNNGLGSSVATQGGLFQNHAVAIGTFPMGNSINQTRLVGNKIDIGFFYTARAPDGTGNVNVTASGSPTPSYQLYANKTDVPVGATILSSYPFTTDGFVTLLALAKRKP